MRENSGRDGGIEEPYWGPSHLIPSDLGFFRGFDDAGKRANAFVLFRCPLTIPSVNNIQLFTYAVGNTTSILLTAITCSLISLKFNQK